MQDFSDRLSDMTNRCVRGLFLLALALFASSLPTNARAHPHVWVDYYVDAVSNKDGIYKLKFRWHFDDMFTSMLKEDFHIRAITPETIATLRDSAFGNLKNYHYYTNLKLDGQPFEPSDISDFNAEVKGQNMEYTFSVQLPHPAKTVEIALYDPEFYVDIGPPVQPLSADKPGLMSSATMKPKDFVTTSADAGATAGTCSWKQGEPRVSASWGKFAVFVVNCVAH
jgi:ABC-type uncharacterized transport system substrate-binding protein